MVKEEFSKAPKMGDIDPTEEPDSERPGMPGRPSDGMDMTQQHKMMHAENINRRETHDENTSMDLLVNIIRKRISYGQGIEEIVNDLKDQHSEEEIFLAYKAATMLDEAILDEMSAVSTGGAAMASSGQVAGSGPTGFSSREKDHEMMWSGDKPYNSSKKKS